MPEFRAEVADGIVAYLDIYHKPTDSFVFSLNLPISFPGELAMLKALGIELEPDMIHEELRDA